MLSKMVRSVNLALAGLLAGNELGTWAAVHPSLEKLGPPERIRAEQELTKRFGEIMPFWTTIRRSRGRWGGAAQGAARLRQVRRSEGRPRRPSES